MPIQSVINTSPRQYVRIVTVDPRLDRIEGLLRDGAIVQIPAPNGFLIRWPKEDEIWLIEYINGWPSLISNVTMTEEDSSAQGLLPGEAQLKADRITFTGAGSFIGPLTSPTPDPGANNTLVATTAFVAHAVSELADDLPAHTHPIDQVVGLQAALNLKTPFGHEHNVADVIGLQTVLDGKASTAHGHSIVQVTGLQAALDAKALLSHNHIVGDVTGLQTALDGKAALAHTHVIADVTGLQTALDGKAATSHTHTIANVTGLQTALDGKQPLDSTLTSLANYNTNGILVQTAANVFTGRTILGTVNQINVTSGDGVSGNPTLELPQDIHLEATPTFESLTLNSFTLSGESSAPTVAATDSSTTLATTGFVKSLGSIVAPLMDSVATVGVSDRYARADHIHPTDTSRQIASAELTGLSAISGNGFVTRTGSVYTTLGTAAARTSLGLDTDDIVIFGTVNAGSPSNTPGGGGEPGVANYSAGLVRIVRNLDTGNFLVSSVISDTGERFYAFAGGAARQPGIGFGPGNTAPDTFLTRTAANTLTLSSGRFVSSTDEVTQAGGGVILRSPNGTRYVIRVSDAGALSAVTAASLSL